MKRALILTLSLAVASAAAFAGDHEGKRGSGDRMARMQESLGLSDDQMEQMREIRKNGGSREEMHAVLTDEQRALMEERRGQWQGRRGKRGDHGHGHSHGNDRQSEEDKGGSNQGPE